MNESRHFGVFLATSFVTALMACSSSTGKLDRVTEGLPSWVLHPEIENGIASSDCVKLSGDPSIDRKQVIASARARLAQQIELHVSLLDKAYIRKVSSMDDNRSSSQFESVSKQVARVSLSGASIGRVESLMINNQQHLCAVMMLTPELTESLFHNILKTGNVELTAQDRMELYREFTSNTE